ncbi:PhnD/SsuA/transferrin family substrate-binding protein [Novosphingobium mathurense]|uniref:4,5-dihydroxyphthalate decarboxylase n=1 Tax=Novosphingobium mathurense TaxID=428990 RepID=A0A1U6ILV9_9SPHN|nr:PhnD/SsuA/transferrin family substrate-binding protein [Novosphingobium mathurense]SLK09003.1 4,5-dihydroxyphthalate decarboxylase [Novosphingobium mathurense]
MEKLKLTIALSDTPGVRALRDGRVEVAGAELLFMDVHPHVAAYRQMVREQSFDICELAATTYLVAKSFGYPLSAVPVFLQRGFHHGAVVVREDAGICDPRDLHGRKVGVRAYSVTTGVWGRGILMEEYGLDASKVTWVVDDEEHVSELRLPANVEHVEAGNSIAAMMAAGSLDAGFGGDAGIGRSGAPKAGWNVPSSSNASHYAPLLDKADTLAADWWQRTGIYPIHGVLVIKSSLTQAYPWLADALVEAFEEAKRIWLAERTSGAGMSAVDLHFDRLASIVGSDLLPNGIPANRATLEALQRMALAQKLIALQLPLDELFLPVSNAPFAHGA